MQTRLNKYISETGICSRREADRWIEQGRVKVNGKAPELGTKVSDEDEIFIDEKALKAYYLEHLENNTMSDKGGAGLGFITIGMKSGNKLKVDFKKINDQFSLFTLTSAVNLS